MARIRSIKPEFPQSETIGKLSRDARLLFIQLWTMADDDGRTRAASRMLASFLYPYDDDAPSLIDGWLDELEQNGCIRRYEVDGSKYLDIPNWLKHQKIDHKSPSKIPAFDENFANPREGSRSLAPDRIGSGSGSSKRITEEVIVDETVDAPLNGSEKIDRAATAEKTALVRWAAETWNTMAVGCGLPQVAEIHNGRRAAILARGTDLAEVYDFADAKAGFTALFNKIRGSPFLRGEKVDRDGRGFRCTLDFAVKKSSFTNIMEGKYEDRPNGGARR